MNLRQSLATAIRTVRKNKGLTQEDFGVVSSRTYLSSLERGLKSPTVDKLEEIADKEKEIQDCEFEYNRYAEELTELEALKDEIQNNSDEGFEYGIQLIHENYIDDYLDELLEDCGYIPKDFPHWIEIDWQATYDNMKEDYNEIELNGNTFYVR